MTCRHRILAVDDSPGNLLLLEDILGDEYEVLLASGGREALEIGRALRPELVLLDIVMPDEDGYSVCRDIRLDPLLRSTKVILVSGRSGSTDRLHGYASGADDFVTKPFERDELLAKIRVFLRLRQVEEVARMKDDLLALIGHETRTPISAVMGALQLLEARIAPGDSTATKLHALATENIHRLERLLEASTLLAALRAGRLSLEAAPVSPADLVVRAASEARNGAEAAGVRLQVESAELPLVQGDSTHVPMAVRSVIDHAVQRSAPTETVEIRVGVEGERAVIRVMDRGTALAAAELQSLFEPFDSPDVMQHSSDKGPGLQLALAREVVGGLGGSIEALARPEGGMCFTIRLPVSEPSRASHGTR